jgi:hypothetical protein
LRLSHPSPRVSLLQSLQMQRSNEVDFSSKDSRSLLPLKLESIRVQILSAMIHANPVMIDGRILPRFLL